MSAVCRRCGSGVQDVFELEKAEAGGLGDVIAVKVESMCYLSNQIHQCMTSVIMKVIVVILHVFY